MDRWNYRITRESFTDPDGNRAHIYALREVFYDADMPVAWSEEPTSFDGETPGQVIESLIAAAQWDGTVLDLDALSTVRVTLGGTEKTDG